MGSFGLIFFPFVSLATTDCSKLCLSQRIHTDDNQLKQITPQSVSCIVFNSVSSSVLPSPLHVCVRENHVSIFKREATALCSAADVLNICNYVGRRPRLITALCLRSVLYEMRCKEYCFACVCRGQLCCQLSVAPHTCSACARNK